MTGANLFQLVLAGCLSAWPMATRGDARPQEKEKPEVQIPDPGVKEIMTLEGNYVRAAYNNEGYVILGYRLANETVGKEWMLLEFGVTLREDVPDFRLTREALSLETPDGKTIPLPELTEYRKSTEVRGLQHRARVQRDSINYFPASATHACRVGFFTDLGDRPMPWDAVELSYERACLGRLYFPIPGGISYGQHWLNVKFQESLIRVPFRILTEEEEEFLSKNFKDIEKQVEEAFKKKG